MAMKGMYAPAGGWERLIPSKPVRQSAPQDEMIFLGIDPGLSGAVARLDARGRLLVVVDIPTLSVGSKREYDRLEIQRMLKKWMGPLTVACVELVHAMPGQGVVSMWRMGQGFELWMMALTMLDIAIETVTPQRWKGVMLDGLPKDKDASRYRAKQLWPNQVEYFTRKKDNGRAEAALIAEYLRRQWVKDVAEELDERGAEDVRTSIC